MAQPITVRPLWNDASSLFGRSTPELVTYEIVAGERRFRAVSQVLGRSEIPAIVRELSNEEASAIMLIENVQRVDLNPLDEANGYQRRIDRFGWTISQISRVANVSERRIASRLELLRLVPEAQKLIADGQLGVQFGECMSPLDANRQRIALQYIVQSERPLLREFRSIVGKLLAEQAQESLFDLSALMAQAVEEETVRHQAKYDRRFPVDENLPAMKKVGSIGMSLEVYIDKLIRTGNHQAAAVAGRIYQSMLESGMCYPPRENSPLQP